MNVITRITKLLKNSRVLIDDVTEAVKHEIRKKECAFVGAFVAL